MISMLWPNGDFTEAALHPSLLGNRDDSKNGATHRLPPSVAFAMLDVQRGPRLAMVSWRSSKAKTCVISSGIYGSEAAARVVPRFRPRTGHADATAGNACRHRVNNAYGEMSTRTHGAMQVVQEQESWEDKNKINAILEKLAKRFRKQRYLP